MEKSSCFGMKTKSLKDLVRSWRSLISAFLFSAKKAEEK
jgi:hypothetical protein